MFKNYYIIIILLSFCILSCKKSLLSEKFNDSNIEEAVKKTFYDSEITGAFIDLYPLIDYIDNNQIIFKDSCTNAMLLHMRAAKERVVKGNEALGEYIFEAEKYAKGCDDLILLNNIYNTLGIYYGSINDYKAATEALKKSVFYGKKIQDKTFVVATYARFCKLNIKIKQWSKVIDYASKGIEIINNKDSYFNTNHFNRVKELYRFRGISKLKLNKLQEANFDLDTAIIHTKNYLKTRKISKDYYNSFREIYLAKSELNEKKNDYKTANKFIKSADSLVLLINDFIKFNIEDGDSRYLYKEIKLNEDLIESNRKVIRNQNIIVVFIVLFLIGSILFIFNRINYLKKIKYLFDQKIDLNNKLKNNLIELENNNNELKINKEKIEYLLEQNKQKLFAKTFKISTYKDGVNNIINSISKLINEDKEIHPSKLLFINRSLGDIFSEEEVWLDFKAEFESNRPYFFKKLKEMCPQLSVMDQKHCAYVAINLKSKEVANIINVSPRTVETARYRIKKKIGLEEKSLDDFLKAV
ncbi:regulatory protein, luxR family [Lutibacter sp. Hel_I_33_5]|uniref:helix-turn-helix transcriptional regulator n=1 Tax=Lutibacter sp. Hel_I_33_5 TaxID=1566289 RepID=UPI0011A316EA|nr:hypothetical protein [Lutibacter sp. Hel_I_33_5]TVZ55318.1 regulatory protein, luxR family [Lutibacter sp. Hel_I_33_5]